MLSTGYSFFWPGIALGSLGFAIGIAIYAFREVRRMATYAAECTSWLETNNMEALKDSKLGKLESSLTELWDSHSSLLASHKRLRSKYGMRDLRERRNAEHDDPNGELDLATTRDKTALRLELRKRGLLK